MTEPKWTPGPWTTSLTDETFVRSADNDVAVMIGDYSDDATSLIMAANANLISAAPDLYTATDWANGLIPLLEVSEDKEITFVQIQLSSDAIRALIDARRKARGE